MPDKRDEMLTLNAIRCVSILLSTECESMGIIKSSTLEKEIEEPKKSQDELIVGILKCLGHFTTYAVRQCAEQVREIINMLPCHLLVNVILNKYSYLSFNFAKI